MKTRRIEVGRPRWEPVAGGNVLRILPPTVVRVVVGEIVEVAVHTENRSEAELEAIKAADNEIGARRYFLSQIGLASLYPQAAVALPDKTESNA